MRHAAPTGAARCGVEEERKKEKEAALVGIAIGERGRRGGDLTERRLDGSAAPVGPSVLVAPPLTLLFSASPDEKEGRQPVTRSPPPWPPPKRRFAPEKNCDTKSAGRNVM